VAGPIVVPPGGGEVVGDAPDRRVEILSEHEGLHATWSRFGPGREGADLHIHRRHTDCFYVLDGSLTLRLGLDDEPVAVPAGALVRVPPFVVHGFRNASGGEVRYLNLHAPGRGFAEYLRAMRDGRPMTYDQEPPPAEGIVPATEAVVGGAEPLSEGTTLLADVEELGIAEFRVPGGARAIPPHAHERHAESLYVLEGELELTAGEATVRIGAGTWVEIPPGLPHAVSYPAPVRSLSLHAPSCGFGDYLRALAAGDAEDAAAERSGFDRVPA
jgi:mannose-6-phosphate isomerase-like protein (cupin superfamily)